MAILDVIQIAINAILSLWLASLCLTDPVAKVAIRNQWTGSAELKIAAITFGIPMMIHLGAITGCWVGFGRAVAVLASSGIFLHWAMLSYFSLQKYENRANRPLLVMRYPLCLPTCLLFGVISGIAACLQYLPWYWVFVIIPAWLFYGVGALEWKLAAIKREHGMSRREAIRAINLQEGLSLGAFIGKDRYPFP